MPVLHNKKRCRVRARHLRGCSERASEHSLSSASSIAMIHSLFLQEGICDETHL